MAPTVMTFLAAPGDETESGLPGVDGPHREAAGGTRILHDDEGRDPLPPGAQPPEQPVPALGT